MNEAAIRELAGPPKSRKPVRPRDAASLILLRGPAQRLEVLVGRRSPKARFMPGVYVFPGGAIDPPDGIAWSVETGAEALAPRLARAARAALRETWEEVGVLVGEPATAPPPNGPLANRATAMLDEAYRRQGLVAAFARLTYVGRAITPSHSARRFNTRFFLGDGDSVFGEPAPSEELEDAGWHRISQGMLDGFADVTRFMLARAIALRSGVGAGETPLFYWAKNARRIGICRENRR